MDLTRKQEKLIGLGLLIFGFVVSLGGAYNIGYYKCIKELAKKNDILHF